MALRYRYFRNSKRVCQASENNPPMVRGETSHGVGIVQAALIRCGFPMPISTKRKHGAPDRIFGDETFATAKAFQTRHGLGVDGIIGRQTIAKLDELMMAIDPPPKPRPPRPIPPRPTPPPPRPVPPRPNPPNPVPPPSPPVPPPPPPPIVVPPDPDFKAGTDDPQITPDDGSGVWNSKSVEVTTYIMYEAITDPRAMGAAYVAIGDDAVETLRHYFGNTGSDHTIDLAEMVEESPEAKDHYEFIVGLFQRFVERLPVGTADITSKHAWSGYNHKERNRNWFFAIGGYAAWIKGRVTVTMAGGVKQHAAEVTYKFFDRYNWDGGKKVDIAGIVITDEFMGEFHRQGLAREYNNYGSFRRSLRWALGDAIPSGQLHPGGR